MTKGADMTATVQPRIGGAMASIARTCMKCGVVFLSSIPQDTCGPFGCEASQ